MYSNQYVGVHFGVCRTNEIHDNVYNSIDWTNYADPCLEIELVSKEVQFSGHHERIFDKLDIVIGYKLPRSKMTE